jgi:protein-L-isoaspartate(D-aspartate) O-methyltransferase
LTERSFNANGGAKDLDPARRAMIAHVRRYVRDERVVDVMAAVAREQFLPSALRARAYDDSALPIGEGQTVSQPLMVALMLQAAEIAPGDRVLEVGTGSGYQAALLSRLADKVVSVERVAALRDRAAQSLAEGGFRNVDVELAGEGELGWPAGGAYDAIVVAAGAPHVPRALIAQLAVGGRLVIPVGNERAQDLVRARKTEHGVELARLGACAFVPLIGREAWEAPRRGFD